MSVVTFPGNKGNEPPEPPTDQKVLWVCSCGNTTFHLRPDLVCECAHCHTIISAGEPIGAWKIEAQPPIPREVPQDSLGSVVVDMNDNGATLRRVLKWLEEADLSVIIAIEHSGSIKTYGGIDGEQQAAWLERRLERARTMLNPDHVFDAKYAEPDPNQGTLDV